jgi:hypothetical protein
MFIYISVKAKKEEEEVTILMADRLNSQEYKELFNKMLNDCYKYATAINAKGKEPFPTEPLIMALLLSQPYKEESQPIILLFESFFTLIVKVGGIKERWQILTAVIIIIRINQYL